MKLQQLGWLTDREVSSNFVAKNVVEISRNLPTHMWIYLPMPSLGNQNIEPHGPEETAAPLPTTFAHRQNGPRRSGGPTLR